MTALAKLVPRNAALLITLLALLVVAPLVPFETSGLVVELIFDAVLLAGVYSTGETRHRTPFVVLTVVTLGVRWGELVFDVAGLSVTALALTVAWLVFALSIIVTHLFRQRDVTVDTILGAIVAYLLAAVAFAMLFQILEIQRPGSFSGIPDEMASDRQGLGDVMLYFSMVCITTMGYGDIVPVSEVARPLSVVEGMFGQFYLAVMIARLVGLQLAREQN